MTHNTVCVMLELAVWWLGVCISDGDVGYYQAFSYSNDPNMDRQHILMSNDELQRVSLAAGALRYNGVNHIYDCVIECESSHDPNPQTYNSLSNVKVDKQK